MTYVAEHPLDPESYDWREAFEYARGRDVRRAIPVGDNTPTTGFTRDDVASIEAYSEGENDGDDWICFGVLKDGRWFYLEAGCDYTGWDCQAGGSVTVAPDRTTLLHYGIAGSRFARLSLDTPQIVFEREAKEHAEKERREVVYDNFRRAAKAMGIQPYTLDLPKMQTVLEHVERGELDVHEAMVLGAYMLAVGRTALQVAPQ